MNYMSSFASGARRVEKYMVPWEYVRKEEVYRRDNWKCAYCGVDVVSRYFINPAARPFASVDHVVPISLGGSHTYSNMVTACEPCNFSKGSDPSRVDIAMLLPLLKE